MKLVIEVNPPTRWRDQFTAELKVPNETPIGVTVVGMGITVGDAIADAGRQLAGAVDEQVG